MITWNNVTSDSLGIFVEAAPFYVKPKRKVDVYSVPGRSGDIIRPQDAWDNVDQDYEIFAGDGSEHAVPGAFSSVAAWLYGPSGYQRLEDDFDPDHFRLAHFVGPVDIDNIMTRVGRAKITFNCKPQRFLKSGEKKITFTSNDEIRNNTLFPAKPLILIYGNGTAGIGQKTIEVKGNTYPYVEVDCETMDAFYGATNCNSMISLTSGDFPVLNPGDNGITLGKGIPKIELIPRWWIV